MRRSCLIQSRRCKGTAPSTGHWTAPSSLCISATHRPARLPPWLIGRDEASDGYEILYFDAPGLTDLPDEPRMQNLEDLGEAPGFWQRFGCTLAYDGASMTGHWKVSLDDGLTWQRDFDVA